MPDDAHNHTFSENRHIWGFGEVCVDWVWVCVRVYVSVCVCASVSGIRDKAVVHDHIKPTALIVMPLCWCNTSLVCVCVCVCVCFRWSKASFLSVRCKTAFLNYSYSDHAMTVQWFFLECRAKTPAKKVWYHFTNTSSITTFLLVSTFSYG